jgi:general secretion pathway protein A
MQEIATLSRGVPRVINILCDRALENAWSDQTHTVDTAAVVRAAKSLSIDVPLTVSDRLKRFQAPVAVAAAVGAAALLLWTVGSAAMARWNRPAPAPPLRAAQQAARPAPVNATAQTTPPPAAATPSKLQAAPPESATADKLLIVVSSFRTKDRSAQVAADIVAQGLPAFVRSYSGWQQVVVGPYLSRDEAVAAQKRLAGARYPDTKVVSATAATP